MTHNRTASFWDVNKASVFIDAMNAANSQHHYPAAEDANCKPILPAGNRWMRKLVTISTLAMFGGLMMLNWIA